MTWFAAVLLGLIEGLTEFLPVSSTGHLILLGDRLGAHGDAAKTFEIVIQLGAIIACVLYYRRRLGQVASGMLRRDPASLRLVLALGIAFVPAAIVGLLFHKAIKAHLFGPLPVAAALVVGGVVMIVVERVRKKKAEGLLAGLEHVTPRRALAIGLAQCFALWPGASRSMTTIVGGQLTGLDTATAAEFSFLLAIPTLGAATLFDLAKNGRALLHSPGGAEALVIGLVVSFVVAWLVIAAFLRYLGRTGLEPFGIYRVLLGALVLAVALGGASTGATSSPATAASAAASASP